MNNKRPVRVVLPRRALGLLSVLLLGILGIIFVFIYLPKAVITITPAVTEKTAEQTILLSTKQTEPNFVQYVLPAKLTDASAHEEKTFDRPGSATIDDFAKGEVTLVNNLDDVQELLPKTNLRHEASGVFFLTNFPVAIPAHGSTRMAVTAKEKGEKGNVPAGRFVIDKLAADLQSDVYAESKAAFTGGVAVETPLSQEEIDQAKQEVLKMATERAQVELSTKTGGVPVRSELTHTTATEETVSAEAGSKAKSFTVSTTVQAQAFLVDQNDLLSLTLLALRGSGRPGDEKTASDQEFIAYAPESFQIAIQQADFERGEAKLSGKIRGTFASKIGPMALDPTPLAGLSSEEVQAYFKNNQAVGKVEVKLSPFWVRSVPGRKGAVEIKVASGG